MAATGASRASSWRSILMNAEARAPIWQAKGGSVDTPALRDQFVASIINENFRDKVFPMTGTTMPNAPLGLTPSQTMRRL